MTDGELGRRWSAANGRAPRVLSDGEARWACDIFPEMFTLPKYADRLPFALTKLMRDVNGDDTLFASEAAAYAAVGAALRQVWAFADESVRACDPLPAGCVRLGCEACDGLGYVDRKDGEQ